MKPSTFRVLGLATMSCASLEQAIGVMLRYQRLVSESGTLAAHPQANGDVMLVHTGQTLKVRILPQPEETLQAHLDLRGNWMLPIHNGTFDLAMHTWHEPFDRITALAKAKGVAITTPCMGEPLNLRQPHAGSA